MRSIPPYAAMTRFEVANRFLSAILPTLSASTSAGLELIAASKALSGRDLKSAIDRLDRAMDSEFQHGYQTTSKEAWIAVAARALL